jgi:hypothetical protein
MSTLAHKFPMGLLVAIPGVLAQIPQPEIQRALARHLSGDWGDLCAEDAHANEQALVDGTRLPLPPRRSGFIVIFRITRLCLYESAMPSPSTPRGGPKTFQ